MRLTRNQRRIAIAVLVAVIVKVACSTAHGTAGGTAVPVTNGSETAFIDATLTDLGAPETPADVTSMGAWYSHEYPSWPPGAANNPWDTTLYEPGAAAFNTFDGDEHVWDYPTAAGGAEATAETIAAGYPAIAAALRSGAGVCGPGFAADFGAWSGDSYWKVC